MPITVPEAALGAKIEVPTIDGKGLLRVPPGTQSGQKFRLRDQLTGCIGCGCLSLKRCSLYNPDDRLAAAGPGPRILLGAD